MSCDFAMQLHRDVELAELLERLFEMYLAAVDVKALGFELVRDISRSNRAEELIVLAHFANECERYIVELSYESLGLGLLLRRLANRRCLHLLDHSLVG